MLPETYGAGDEDGRVSWAELSLRVGGVELLPGRAREVSRARVLAGSPWLLFNTCQK